MAVQFRLCRIAPPGAPLHPQAVLSIRPMYRNAWFQGRNSLRQLPPECVADCSGSGDRTADVAAWVRRLDFDGPAWLFREYLREFGAWDRSDLCDHNANRERVLWTWACNCAEEPGAYDYLYLGI